MWGLCRVRLKGPSKGIVFHYRVDFPCGSESVDHAYFGA